MKPNIFSKGLKLMTLLSFFLITYSVKAQDMKEVNDKTYHITDNGSVKNIQPYIDAMNNSDFKNHRLRNKRYTVAFQSGLKVELFSAEEISRGGQPINLLDYPENFDSSRQEPIFALGANNFIMEYHTSTNKENKVLKK